MDFKNQKQWDDWKCKVVTMAHAHGCEDVLNPSYYPGDVEKIELFHEKQNFMYDVFLTTKQASMGKQFVRKNETHRDAQKVWALLDEYMKT